MPTAKEISRRILNETRAIKEDRRRATDESRQTINALRSEKAAARLRRRALMAGYSHVGRI